MRRVAARSPGALTDGQLCSRRHSNDTGRVCKNANLANVGNLLPECLGSTVPPATPMLVPARRRDQRRQTIEQFHRCQHQADAAAKGGLDALAEHKLGIGVSQSIHCKNHQRTLPKPGPRPARTLAEVRTLASTGTTSVKTTPKPRSSNCPRQQITECL